MSVSVSVSLSLSLTHSLSPQVGDLVSPALPFTSPFHLSLSPLASSIVLHQVCVWGVRGRGRGLYGGLGMGGRERKEEG